MPITATGDQSLAEDRLRHTVAGSATFRSLTSTANETAALARVHLGEAPEGASLPLAVVGWRTYGRQLYGSGLQQWWDRDEASVLEMQFRESIQDTDDGDARRRHTNNLDAILLEMEALADSARGLSSSAYLDFEAWHREASARPEDAEARTEGDFYGSRVAFDLARKGGP